jgi:hypothetical protein
MGDPEEKKPRMSDCAYCGETMDFVPDDTRHQFEVECEHCQKINTVTWVIGGPARWYTAIRQD